MRLSKSAAFYLQASIILFFLASSSAPTPLYAVYQAMWGFSPIAVTVVFGIYAVAVLSALLVTGALSDHVGRRPVLIAATLVQAGAMAMFATADGLGALIAARIVQGLATGAAASAVGAGLLDLDRTRGTLANALAPMLGTATGGVLAGVMVQYLPWPTRLVYGALAAMFVAQAIGVWRMPETAQRRPGALASLRPRFRLPPAVRAPMMLAVPALVAAWALTGFYGSLGPSLLRGLLSGIAWSRSPALGGLPLLLLAGGGAITAVALRAWQARPLLITGTVALIAGTAITLIALAVAAHPAVALAVFVVGGLIAGVGFGGAFQGAIRSVVPLASASERAGVLSVVYVVSYLSMGVPAVLGGIRCVHGGGVATTAREYGVAVIALAAAALIGTIRTRVRVGAVAVPAR